MPSAPSNCPTIGDGSRATFGGDWFTEGGPIFSPDPSSGTASTRPRTATLRYRRVVTWWRRLSEGRRCRAAVSTVPGLKAVSTYSQAKRRCGSSTRPPNAMSPRCSRGRRTRRGVRCTEPRPPTGHPPPPSPRPRTAAGVSRRQPGCGHFPSIMRASRVTWARTSSRFGLSRNARRKLSSAETWLPSRRYAWPMREAAAKW